MLCDVWGRIGTGPVRYLAESWETLVDISKFPHQPLLDFFLAIPPNDWTEEVRVPYNDSALALARTFSCMHGLDEKIATLDVVRFWPIRNSVEYVELLSNWHPGALILLAHYCIVLHRVRTTIWYLQGRAASMLSTIVRRLDLTWPLRVICAAPRRPAKLGDEMTCEAGMVISSTRKLACSVVSTMAKTSAPLVFAKRIDANPISFAPA